MNAGLRRQRQRTLASTVVGIGITALTGCGTCLLVQNQDAELHTAAGEAFPVRIAYRTPDGILNLDDRWWIGLFLEPVDWCVSLSTACRAPFDEEIDLAWGPLGFLATLTPFATYFPAPDGKLARTSVVVDDTTLGRIRAGDIDAACEAFGDRRIRTVHFR